VLDVISGDYYNDNNNEEGLIKEGRRGYKEDM
jgi:hypothetical protein